MNSIVTTGVVLARTNYGEADRIITVITPDQGKLRLMVKGARRIRSKLAGGIELFSISEMTFIQGRGEINTLTSSRLQKHFGRIISDIDRTMFGYELLKLFNRVTEDMPESDYYELLATALEALDDPTVPLENIRLWTRVQLLKLGGHAVNLKTDNTGQKLTPEMVYNFSFDDMVFVQAPRGNYGPSHIKILRLAHGLETPLPLGLVTDIKTVMPELLSLVNSVSKQHLRV